MSETEAPASGAASPSISAGRISESSAATACLIGLPAEASNPIGQFFSRKLAHTVEIPQRCHLAVESRDFLAVSSVLCFGNPYCNG
jgi:hypothetical protein